MRVSAGDSDACTAIAMEAASRIKAAAPMRRQVWFPRANLCVGVISKQEDLKQAQVDLSERKSLGFDLLPRKSKAKT